MEDGSLHQLLLIESVCYHSHSNEFEHSITSNTPFTKFILYPRSLDTHARLFYIFNCHIDVATAYNSRVESTL